MSRLLARSRPALQALAMLLAGCLGGGAGGEGDPGGGPNGGGPGGDAGSEGAGHSRAHDLIRGDPHRRLVIQVDHVPGFAPRPAVEAALAEGLAGLLDKPGGVEVVHHGEIESRGGDHGWSFAELDVLARESFDHEIPPDTIAIHTLFVDGHYQRDQEGEGRVLGLAWAHTHIVMFKQTLEEVCGASPLAPVLRERLCRGAELSVWTHEVGHLLGLVDNGIPMTVPRRDEERGAHDQSPDCVMYWAYAGEAVLDQIHDQLVDGGEESLGFDDACVADVAAVRDAR